MAHLPEHRPAADGARNGHRLPAAVRRNLEQLPAALHHAVRPEHLPAHRRAQPAAQPRVRIPGPVFSRAHRRRRRDPAPHRPGAVPAALLATRPDLRRSQRMTWSHVDNNKWPTDGLSFGADYNPEQWDRSVWREDMTLMREAGVNLVSLGIFSWGLLEVADGEYDWDWFDQIVDLLEENGIAIDLATPTAAPPGWLLHAHPEILPVEADGLKHWPGARLGWCPSSPIFREYSLRIVRGLADRYGARDHVVMWHVSNELGGGHG